MLSLFRVGAVYLPCIVGKWLAYCHKNIIKAPLEYIAEITWP